MADSLEKLLGFDTSPRQSFARPETIFFWWGRSPAVIFWAASYFKNALYIYGNREDQLLNRIARATRLSNRKFEEPELSKTVARPRRKAMRETGFKDHAQVVFYDFTRSHGEFALSMKKISSTFVYRQPESAKTLIGNLQTFRSDIAKAYKDSPYGALRRKGLLMFLLLDHDSLEDLKQSPAAIAILQDIFETGNNERIYLILCTQYAEDLSPELVAAAESAIFIGEANQNIAEKFYAVPVTDNDYGAIKIGVAWDITKPDTLRKMAAVKLEKENWVIERQAAIKQQDSDWLEYLNELKAERN